MIVPALRLLRRPLLWAVIVETALVAAAVGVGWRIVVGRSGPAPPPVARPAPPPAPSPSSLPALPAVSPGPSPGLRQDPGFVLDQMDTLNRIESELERLEWRAVDGIARAIRAYLERVVLPAVSPGDRDAG
ncbi:MAG TPA: hypothetical protein VFD49_08800 [Candidatus Dormibacteraeota bacterium]|nr:hypothetical protein [Candidatus Dormibacteraeota bacterium]